MKSNKRLFLFAGFDRDNVVDDTVIYYVEKLSKLGDIVFIMDNDLPKTEIQKIAKIPNVLYADGIRHNEYDFGSYKRGYLWAKKKVKQYDWLYFVNDSVYGPLYDLEPLLKELESSNADLTGMCANSNKDTPWHVQSWFVGFSQKVFTCDFFDNFMQKITRISNKTSLVMKYEVGLSWLIMHHGFTGRVVLDADKNTIYDAPRSALVNGVPFIKKTAVAKLRKMYFLYPYVKDDTVLDYISAHMKRHHIKMVKDSFSDIYELRLFGIPILRISAKVPKYYKVYLFKHIPILKIIK